MSEAGMLKQRQAMVDRQLAGRGIRDKRVLDAMSEVPRENFVPETIAASTKASVTPSGRSWLSIIARRAVWKSRVLGEAVAIFTEPVLFV